MQSLSPLVLGTMSVKTGRAVVAAAKLPVGDQILILLPRNDSNGGLIRSERRAGACRQVTDDTTVKSPALLPPLPGVTQQLSPGRQWAVVASCILFVSNLRH